MLKVSKVFNYLYLLIGVPWLFFMIVTSRRFTLFKTILLIILTLVCLLEMLIYNKSFCKKQFIFIVIFVTYFTISLMYGIFREYDWNLKNDFSLIQYYIITPILILILVNIFNNKKRIYFTLNLLKYITLITLILDILKIMSLKGLIPDIDIFNLIYISSDVQGKELALRVSNEVSFIFLLPIYIVLFFSKKNNKKEKKIYFLIILLGILYSVLSGRKILEIVVFATLLFMVIKDMRYLNSKTIKNILAFISIIVILFLMLNYFSNSLDIENIINKIVKTIMNGLDSNSYGMTKRTNNFEALFLEWFKSPLWGNGLNSYSTVSLASGTTKWAYEIVYVALLSQTGIIGIMLFSFAIFYIVFNLLKYYRKSKRDIYLAFFMGFLSFIIAGATNPLVYYLWPWLLCFMLCKYDFN